MKIHCKEKKGLDILLRTNKFLLVILMKKKLKLDLVIMRLNFCSLLVARYFLLVARCSILFAHCSLLFARCSLLVTFCLLLVTFSSLFFARCSLLFACYFLLVAFCSLLVTFCSFSRCLLWNKVAMNRKKMFQL